MNDHVTIIAEAGVNHNGSLDRALALVDVAADAKADVVKFQTFRTELEISRHAATADYQKKNAPEAQTQLELVRALELNHEQFRAVLRHCEERKIAFLSTPFDSESLAFLVGDLKVPTLKLASGEVTNGPLLLAAAKTGRPIILSTGMSTLGEIEFALGVLAFGYLNPTGLPFGDAPREAFRSAEGQAKLRSLVTLLHCTTEYPAPIAEVNLRAMDTIADAFGLPVGFSDHTPGIAVSIAAAARGAVVIEKHFTTDKALPGPDHKASLEPEELRALVQGVREAALALGSRTKIPAASELKNIPIARRSIVARTSIAQGEKFTEENLITKRPGTGLSPMAYWDLLGRRARRAYDADDLINENVDLG